MSCMTDGTINSGIPERVVSHSSTLEYPIHPTKPNKQNQINIKNISYYCNYNMVTQKSNGFNFQYKNTIIIVSPFSFLCNIHSPLSSHIFYSILFDKSSFITYHLTHPSHSLQPLFPDLSHLLLCSLRPFCFVWLFLPR